MPLRLFEYYRNWDSHICNNTTLTPLRNLSSPLCRGGVAFPCACLRVDVSNLWCMHVCTYPGVGQGGIVVLCVELQRDEGDVGGDPGDHCLNWPILRDTHILEGSKGKHHAIWGQRRQLSSKIQSNAKTPSVRTWHRWIFWALILYFLLREKLWIKHENCGGWCKRVCHNNNCSWASLH